MSIGPATQKRSILLDIAEAWSRSPHGVKLATTTAIAVTVTTAAVTAVPIAVGAALLVLIVAALVDLDQYRLPDHLLGVAAIVLVLGGLLESLNGHALAAGQMLVGAIVFTVPLLALHLCSPTSMGFGDVKLGPLLGAAGGSFDWQLSLWVLALGAAVSAGVAVVRHSPVIALGPGLVGATITLLAMTNRPVALQISAM